MITPGYLDNPLSPYIIKMEKKENSAGEERRCADALWHWKSPLAATLILVLLIAAASFRVTDKINDMEEEASFTRLAQEADELALSLELNVHSDREKLQLIAEMMAADLGEPEEFLRFYKSTGTFFSRLELLLPGDPDPYRRWGAPGRCRPAFV